MIRGSPLLSSAAERARFPRRDLSGWLQPASWCALGFLAGIAFWHMVGFWSLVSTAVFRGEDMVAIPTLPSRAPAPASPPVGPKAQVEASAIKPNCAVLSLDRIAGTTRQMPCPAATFHHRDRGLGEKGDRDSGIRVEDGAGLAGWATRLDAAERP